LITYEDFLGGIRVKLDNKVVGTISTVFGGFQYQPKGSKVFGEVFPTVDEVKLSLEAGAPARVENPIPFNAEMLTIFQGKAAIDTLKLIFDLVDRDGLDPDQFVEQVKGHRDFLLRQWGRG
jgi:hypothetical protein